jgi:hypothetical protein
MLGQFPTASLYGMDVRLVVWLVPVMLFVLLLPRPAPRLGALAVLGLLMLGWDFGAALIWATGYASKVRFDFVLEGSVGSWLLLACAVLGTLAAGAATRAFAHHDRQAGWVLAAVAALTFVLWSAVVRFSPLIAASALIVGVCALAAAGHEVTAAAEVRHARKRAYTGTITGLVWVGTVVGAAMGFTVWASIQLAKFGQACPFGVPGAGHPVRLGGASMIAATLVILATRWQSHQRGAVIALCFGAACAVGVLDLVGWWLVGVSHYCSD